MKAARLARLSATWGATWAGLWLFVAPVAASAAEPPHAVKPARAGASSKAVRAVVDSGADSEELAALREAERGTFSPEPSTLANAGPPELPVLPVLSAREGAPRVVASGVPPSEPWSPLPHPTARDLSWIAGLEMPDLPIRWDERLVQYLVFFRDDPRGHAMFANLFRHSGRFRDMMRRELRQKALPEDLVWVSMIESAFDPAARSPSGAAGLWQFMPETGKIYGLTIDRWLDQRYSPELATEAAADMLGDLHRRLGSWELALAAYNMGYGGLAAVVRRYNTNDFWSLARTEGTLPWQTTLYVPRILAASVIAHNLAAFGFGELALDPPVESDPVDVPPAMPLALVARDAGCDSKDVEGLNPELRAARTPPGDGESRYVVRVPQGKGAALVLALARQHRSQPAVERHVVLFGETLERIAAAHKTTTQRLVELNAIAPGEVLRGGTTLLVPRVDGPAAPAPTTGQSGPEKPSTQPNGHATSALFLPLAAPPAPSPSVAPDAPDSASDARDPHDRVSVVVPADEFVYPGRQRVFYRVLAGDAPERIARALDVPVDDLLRWNCLDPSARLQEGMTIQAFVPSGADLSRLAVIPEANAHVVAVGSEEFFAPLELSKRVTRVTVAARAGETLESIGKRFDVTPRTMEWINRRGRADPLHAGETVVVYLPGQAWSHGASLLTASTGRRRTGRRRTGPCRRRPSQTSCRSARADRWRRPPPSFWPQDRARV